MVAPRAGQGRLGARSALPYLLLFPTLFFVGLFTLWPTVLVIHDSLFRSDNATPVPVFMGLGNYAALAADPAFRQVLINTILYVAVTVPASVLLALLLALALNRRFRGLGMLRLAFFYPAILPMVSAATVWLFMYTPDYGLVNVILGIVHIPSQNFLGTPGLALAALMVLGIWKQTGYFMIFFLAGLQGLSREVFEAADLDGATPTQTLRYLTLPLLRGTTLFVTTIAVVNAFETVDQLYIMTGGGPNNSTGMLLFDLWQTLFSFFDLGKASAISVILIAVLLLFTVGNFIYMERRTTYE